LRGKALYFFGTKEELIEVFKEASLKLDFKLFDFLDTDHKEAKVYQSIEEIEDIGISLYGTNKEKMFLIIPKDEIPKKRAVKLRDGGFSYHADQGNNPKSLVFDPGGVYRNYEAIIVGEINTISNDEWSLKMYNVLHKIFKKNFTHYHSSNYLSKVAEEKLDEGVRLTRGVGMPTLYDLAK